MKRIISPSLAATLILLSPGLPYYQAFALPEEASSRTESVSHERYAQNVVGWNALLATSDVLQPFGISDTNNFIEVAAGIPDLEPRLDLTSSDIKDGMRAYVHNLASFVSESADPAKPVNWVRLDRLNDKLNQVRPFVADIVPDSMAVLNRASAQAIESRDATLSEPIEDAAKAWIPGSYKILDPRQQDFINGVLVPTLGRRTVWADPKTARPIETSPDGFVLKFLPQENDLAVRWTTDILWPHVVATHDQQQLLLPQGATNVAPYVLYHWTAGNSLHPYVAEPSVIHERRALGEDPVVTPRPRESPYTTRLNIWVADPKHKGIPASIDDAEVYAYVYYRTRQVRRARERGQSKKLIEQWKNSGLSEESIRRILQKFEELEAEKSPTERLNEWVANPRNRGLLSRKDDPSAYTYLSIYYKSARKAEKEGKLGELKKRWAAEGLSKKLISRILRNKDAIDSKGPRTSPLSRSNAWVADPENKDLPSRQENLTVYMYVRSCRNEAAIVSQAGGSFESLRQIWKSRGLDDELIRRILQED